MATDGVQRIIQEIEKSTEQKISGVLSEARQKVEATLNDARTQADEQDRSIVARGDQEARRESQRILAEARIKARREKIKAQETVVQQSFERAWELLRTLAEKRRAAGLDYRTVLERLIRESVTSAGVGTLEVLVNVRDKDLLSENTLNKIAQETGTQLGIPVRLTFSAESLSCIGGIAVRSNDGTVRVDNTFESRSDRFREAVRTLVAKELFGRELQNG